MAEWERVDRGIRVRRHPTRKHGQMPDKYYVLRYRVGGKYKQEALGWASQGWTLAKARAELAKLKEAARTGVGEVTLKERREKAQAIRDAKKIRQISKQHGKYTTKLIKINLVCEQTKLILNHH